MLDEQLTYLCKGTNFAALTTLFGDGHPQTQVMWVDCDGDHVIVNTERHRMKCRNMERDGRVAVTVWDVTNPYVYVEVRGHVAEMIGGTPAREHIDVLAHLYTGKPYPLEVVSERVIVKVHPGKIVRYG